jgi:hypothetical protein
MEGREEFRGAACNGVLRHYYDVLLEARRLQIFSIDEGLQT